MGICELAREIRSLNDLWESVGTKDATAHELWEEYEWQMGALYSMLCQFIDKAKA